MWIRFFRPIHQLRRKIRGDISLLQLLYLSFTGIRIGPILICRFYFSTVFSVGTFHSGTTFFFRFAFSLFFALYRSFGSFLIFPLCPGSAFLPFAAAAKHQQVYH